MKKFETGKATIFTLIASLMLVIVMAFNSSSSILATNQDSCNQEFTYIVTPENDGDGATVTEPLNDNRVSVDIQDYDNDDDRRVVVNPDSGYQLLFIGVDYENDNSNEATPSVGDGFTTITYTAPNNKSIDRVTVTVKKICATAEPQSVSIDVCHQDGQSGNYSHITVSVHSVNDANGLNGHGDHEGDIWAPFTYNNVNYPGQGNYNGFNLTNCNPNSTPTATATATATATSTATPYPTIDPCALLDIQSPCASSTPTATPSETATATPTPVATPGLTDAGPPHRDSEGSAQGQVLGASTMPGTGSFAENLYLAIMTIGATIATKGLKNFKKEVK